MVPENEFELDLPIGLQSLIEKPNDSPVPDVIKDVVIAETPKVIPLETPNKDLGLDLFSSILGDNIIDPIDLSSDPIVQFANALEINLPEGLEKWSTEALVQSTRERIELSKQQLDLSKYDPDVKLVFDYLQENGGSLSTLMIDETIRDLHEISAYDHEYFFRLDLGRRYLKEGFAEDEIESLIESRIAKIPEEQQDDYFENYHNEKIRTEIKPLISRRLEELNKEKQSYRDRLNVANESQKSKVVDSMIKTAEQFNDFVGLPFSQKSKDVLIAKIKSGDIIKEIEKDSGNYQILGYLFKTMRAQAVTVYKDLMEKQNRSQYFTGVQSTLDQVYNAKRGGNPDDKNLLDDGSAPVNDWNVLRGLTGR